MPQQNLKPTYLGTPIMFQSVKLMKNETIIGNNLKTIRPTRHGSIIHHAIFGIFSLYYRHEHTKI